MLYLSYCLYFLFLILFSFWLGTRPRKHYAAWAVISRPLYPLYVTVVSVRSVHVWFRIFCISFNITWLFEIQSAPDNSNLNLWTGLRAGNGGEDKAKRPVDEHLGPLFHGTRCASDPMQAPIGENTDRWKGWLTSAFRSHVACDLITKWQ